MKDDNIFNLDQQVNGQIQDAKETPNQQSGPAQVTHNRKDEGSNKVVEQSHNSTDCKNATLIVAVKPLNGEISTNKLNNLYLFSTL